MDKTYCLKERKLTGNTKESVIKTKNGRLMKKSICSSCGSKKAMFIKSN